MKVILLFLGLLHATRSDDIFNYGYQTVNVDGEQSYQMSQWNQVSCVNKNTCVSQKCCLGCSDLALRDCSLLVRMQTVSFPSALVL